MVDAIVSVVVEKLGSVLEKEVRLFAGARHELGKLRETFQSIEAVLADAESRQVAERGVQLWLSRLRNVAYDIGDVLDKWVISIDGSSDEDDDDDGGDGNRALAATCLPSPYACLDHTVSRFKVAQSIKDIREKLDQIDKDKVQFQFSQSSSSGGGNRQPVRIRPLTSSHIEEKMIGRQEDKETVIDRLVSGSSSGDQDGLLQAHVIAIVGIGGLGKTTLAREIYHDGRVQSHFNKVLWVCLSEPFDVIMLMKAILEDIEGQKCFLSQPNPLQNKLRKELEGKRFLLVLDDVWNEDEGSWNQLRASLTSGAPGSRILITTRAQKVANTMSAVCIHELKGLSYDDSWGLFSSRAFAGREHEEHLFESIGREIVKKCKGVPLSIKVIGSAMNSKKTVEDWKDILGSKMWSLRSVADKILPALLLSYYNLPAHLKPCFTYCSIYEKDAEMRKRELVELWVAEGLIHSQGNREIEVIGEECFDDLVAWSMFQEVSKDGRTCKMHDLLHDLAQFITRDETYIHTSEKSNQCPANVRHASLSLSENSPSIPSASLQAQKLRTLFLDRVDKIDATLVDLFSQARFLRALRFRRSGIKTLPKTIGKLKHLRYLNLYVPWLVELPNGIAKMKHLQYLNLSGLELVELPNAIGKLKHLRYLE